MGLVLKGAPLLPLWSYPPKSQIQRSQQPAVSWQLWLAANSTHPGTTGSRVFDACGRTRLISARPYLTPQMMNFTFYSVKAPIQALPTKPRIAGLTRCGLYVPSTIRGGGS